MAVADWDSDGDLDLLVGVGDGSVMLFENSGTPRKAKLAAARQIVPPRKVVYGDDAPTDAQRGNSAKVCAADWNGDGRLDLLVGDFTTQKPDRPAFSDEEKAEYDRIRKELAPIQKRYQELTDQLYSSPGAREEEEREKLEQELKEIIEKLQDSRSKLPLEFESHGWVWLYLRK